MLSRLLCRYAWYRRARGGDWTFHRGRWVRIEVTERIGGKLKRIETEIIEPLVFFTDDTSLRNDIRQHLDECNKANQRERT